MGKYEYSVYYDLVEEALINLFGGIDPAYDFFTAHPGTLQALHNYAGQEMRRGVDPEHCAEEFFRWHDVIARFERDKRNTPTDAKTTPTTTALTTEYKLASTSTSTYDYEPRKYYRTGKRSYCSHAPLSRKVLAMREARRRLWKSA